MLLSKKKFFLLSSLLMLALPVAYASNAKRDSYPSSKNLVEVLSTSVNSFFPHAVISNRKKPVYHFVRSSLTIDPQRISYSFRGRPKTVAAMLKETHTDALIVLKNGQLVYEKYYTHSPSFSHPLYSVTKSLTALVATILINEGVLKRDELITHYLPELSRSAYKGATVENLLEQTVGVDFNEDYLNPFSDIYRFMLKAFAPGSAGLRTSLTTLKQAGEHGKKFYYVSPNIDTLCWVIEKASRQTFPQLLEERIWSKLGMSYDASIRTDVKNVAFCGGGMRAAAIDIAKVGQVILDNGYFDHRQVIAKKVVRDIKKGGDPKLFAEGGAVLIPHRLESYQDEFWHTGNKNHAFYARGVFGQWLYIDPTTKVVIVKLSSQILPRSELILEKTLGGLEAISENLQNQSK